MANKIITEISKNKLTSAKFIKYTLDKVDHIKNSKDLKKFLNEYEFILQLGVIKSFLEDEYNIGIHADSSTNMVYYINVKTKEAEELYKKQQNVWIIHNLDEDVVPIQESVFDNYGIAIINAFKFIEKTIENPF